MTDEEGTLLASVGRAVRLIKKGAEKSVDFALSQIYFRKRPRYDFYPLVGFDLNMYAAKR